MPQYLYGNGNSFQGDTSPSPENQNESLSSKLLIRIKMRETLNTKIHLLSAPKTLAAVDYNTENAFRFSLML